MRSRVDDSAQGIGGALLCLYVHQIAGFRSQTFWLAPVGMVIPPIIASPLKHLNQCVLRIERNTAETNTADYQ